MRILLVTAVFVLTAGASAGPMADKAPWEWTDEERIAARLNPDLRQARVAAAKARSQAAASRVPHDVIDGHTDPALFFPIQLFESVMKHAFVNPNAGEDYRAWHRRHGVDAGLPGDFWEQIAVVSTDYIDDLRRHHAALKAKDSSARKLGDVTCRSRAAAYRELRQRFGVVFDRFLYETIMPGMTATYVAPSTPAGLRREAGGCE